MSTDSDLAGWGEPPATRAEEALGTLIDKVLNKIESGKAVKPETLRGVRPELVERGQQLVHTVGLLYECAVSVWENTVMQPSDPRSGTRYSTLKPHGNTWEEPGGQEEGRILPVVGAGELPDPLPGEFRVLRVLGEGAFGRVLLAEDLNLGWQVALKTLKLPATSTLGPQVLAALRTEAQYLAQLDHPNIVRVHAWREAKGEYFLVLQFVAGGSLANKLKAEKVIGWQDAARYIADVGEALVAAHKRGVIHRDIKPDNILWDAARNEAILTDFGVSARLAEPGSVAGTPMYMAPEAFEGQVSPALDVYSLAVTLYQLVTGEHPFTKAPVPGLVYQKLRGLPDPDPRCQAIPEPLERVIRAGLAGRSEARPGMAEFVGTLRATLNQLLADALAAPNVEAESKAPVNLRLVVSRHGPGGNYEAVVATEPYSRGLSRDMKKLPRPPKQVALRTGDLIRIEIVADEAGHVTVFNIGPTGNLNLLYPDSQDDTAATLPAPVQPHVPLQVMDVQMTPPTGKERLFAVWSKEPLSLAFDQLASLVGHTQAIQLSRGYRTTRDMSRVKEAVQRNRQRHSVAVLELDHQG